MTDSSCCDQAAAAFRRLAFLGTPEVAVPLRALVDAGFDIPLVVTRPDKRRRRRGDAEPSPVKAAALDLGLPVSDDIDDVLDADVPLAAVVAFGRLIKPHVLERVPMVNLHYSLLPRWRGAAPVERPSWRATTGRGRVSWRWWTSWTQATSTRARRWASVPRTRQTMSKPGSLTPARRCW